MRKINVVIVGTGGQGVITLRRIIEFAAFRDGVDMILGTEKLGLSQREGALDCCCRFLIREPGELTDERESLLSPTVCYGDADVLIGLEPAETLRNAKFASEKTIIITNEHTIPPVTVWAEMATYPKLEDILSSLKVFSNKIVSLNATKIADEVVGDAQKANMVLLGVALALGALPISYESVKQTIEEEMRDAEMNLKALDAGYNWAKNNCKVY
ncbi:MAG: 2-oxoacid:acceptor oxidoreductase family protein [Candidatus Jordarchaeaceae archaeon]